MGLNIQVFDATIRISRMFENYCVEKKELFMPTDETRIQEECSSYAQSKLQELDLPPVDTSDMGDLQKAYTLIQSTQQLLQDILNLGTEKLRHNGCFAPESTRTDDSACALVCYRHNAEQEVLCDMANLLYRVVDPVANILNQKCNVLERPETSSELPPVPGWQEIENGILALLHYSSQVLTEVQTLIER